MADNRQHEVPMEQTNVGASLLQKQLEAESGRVKELEAELDMERMKIQGMQMLFDCMQEEHAENRRLNNLLKRRKLSLRKLRKRLQSVPSDVIQINWDEFSDLSDTEDGVGMDTRSADLRPENPEDKENNHAAVGFLMSFCFPLALVLLFSVMLAVHDGTGYTACVTVS